MVWEGVPMSQYIMGNDHMEMPMKRITGKNITFPQLRLREVLIFHVVLLCFSHFTQVTKTESRKPHYRTVVIISPGHYCY